MTIKGKVSEVFSSIQGEALYVGVRQVFVRFSGCNLSCGYCDTPQGLKTNPNANIESCAGSREFIIVKNPITAEELAEHINRLLIVPHHSVSLTGGEPLCQAQYITKLAPLISVPLYLETNGTLPRELAQVLPYISIVSMDMKLPYTMGGKEYWQEHESFLKLAATCKKVFVKIVISGETEMAELKRAIDIVAQVDPNITLILQPVTPIGGYTKINEQQIMSYQNYALKMLTDVRVIPQTHKMIGYL